LVSCIVGAIFEPYRWVVQPVKDGSQPCQAYAVPHFDAPVSASSVRLNALLEACRTLLLTNGYCWCLPLSYAIVRLSVAVTLRRQFLQMVLTGSGGVEQT